MSAGKIRVEVNKSRLMRHMHEALSDAYYAGVAAGEQGAIDGDAPSFEEWYDKMIGDVSID